MHDIKYSTHRAARNLSQVHQKSRLWLKNICTFNLVFIKFCYFMPNWIQHIGAYSISYQHSHNVKSAPEQSGFNEEIIFANSQHIYLPYGPSDKIFSVFIPCEIIWLRI